MSIRSVWIISLLFFISGLSCGSARAQIRYTTDDPIAQNEFDQAQQMYEQGQLDGARQAFSSYIVTHPDDPLRHAAELHLGRIAATEDNHEEAIVWLEHAAQATDETLSITAQRELGASLLESGDHTRALEVLEPLAGRVDGQEAAEVYSTLAQATQAAEDPQRQIRYLDALCRYGSREQCDGAKEQINGVVENFSEETLSQLFASLPRNGHSWAAVTIRLATIASETGDIERASELVTQLGQAGVTTDELEEMLRAAAEQAEQVDWAAIGVLLPLDGRMRLVGEQMQIGAEIAAGSEDSDQMLRLVVRDTSAGPESINQALEELINTERVAAIIGPVDATNAGIAAEQAQEHGVPMLALSIRPDLVEQGRWILRAFQSNEADVRTLIRHSMDIQGHRNFAVLHPETNYGNVMRGLVEEEVRGQGGTVVVARSYPRGQTSFVQICQDIAQHEFDALVIADGSRAVALLAPSLATVGIWSRLPSESPPEGARQVQYLLTSSAFNPRLLRTTRQYLQGALFSAIWWADEPDPSLTHFVEEYQAIQEAAPTAYASQAYDAIQVIRAARSQSSGQTRSNLLDALLSLRSAPTVGRFEGFQNSGEPAAPFRLYMLEDETFRRVDTE